MSRQSSCRCAVKVAQEVQCEQAPERMTDYRSLNRRTGHGTGHCPAAARRPRNAETRTSGGRLSSSRGTPDPADRGSLDALAKLGHLVNFGQSSGPVEPLQVNRLAAKSNTLTRPILFHYLEGADQLQEMAKSVFNAFSQGILSTQPGRAFPLAEAATAHAALEARSADGPFVLIPEGNDA